MHFEKVEGLRTERRRRFVAMMLLAVAVIGGTVYSNLTAKPILDNASTAVLSAQTTAVQQLASKSLDKLPVKGRAPKTGYSRSQFGNGWAQVGTCTMRDKIMARDFSEEIYASDTDCAVIGGVLHDPYTATTIIFSRSKPSAVQIDHVIALSAAWQTGAQQLSPALRAQLANDPLELMAVDGPANGEKSDADAASWLPSNKQYRCRYIARQIAVKAKYQLWVTQAEHSVMRKILSSCPNQLSPIEQP